MEKQMNFNQEQCRIIYEAIRYYQIHGIPFSAENQKLCNEIMDMTFNSCYTQRKEQPT